MSSNKSPTPADYDFLRAFVASHTGIELGPDRHYLVENRLLPLLPQFGFASLHQLCLALEMASPPPILRESVIHALSTHETSFFRDPEIFAALRSTILPALLSLHPARPLSLWSAAASSGQEAYSLAILAAEMQLQPPPTITATDISSTVLAQAATGRFTHYELSRGLDNPALLQRYFSPIPGGAAIRRDLLPPIHFLPLDLRFVPPDFPSFDLILCRNVLIYFDQVTRSRVIQHLTDHLLSGGFLLLGAAETIWEDLPRMKKIQLNGHTCFQKL